MSFSIDIIQSDEQLVYAICKNIFKHSNLALFVISTNSEFIISFNYYRTSPVALEFIINLLYC